MGQIKSLPQKHRMAYANVVGFVAIHLVALIALFFPEYTFSWSAVGVMLLLVWMTGSLGICLGFHRYLTQEL